MTAALWIVGLFAAGLLGLIAVIAWLEWQNCGRFTHSLAHHYDPEHALAATPLPADIGSMCLDADRAAWNLRSQRGTGETIRLPRLGNGQGFTLYTDGTVETWQRTVPDDFPPGEETGCPPCPVTPGPESEPSGVTAPVPVPSPGPGGDPAPTPLGGEEEAAGAGILDHDEPTMEDFTAWLEELRDDEEDGEGRRPGSPPVTTATCAADDAHPAKVDSPSPAMPYWDVLDAVKADARAFMAAQDAECAAFLADLVGV